MNILPLGVGGAFTQKYDHANLLIRIGEKHLLVDAGTTLRASLPKARIKEDQIDYIFITHFHHDHVGGLAELLMKSYWRFIDGKHVPHRPMLFLRPHQVQEMEGLLAPSLNHQGLTWHDYCFPVEIHNEELITKEMKLQIIPTDNLHCENLASCGVKITDLRQDSNVIISGDIKKLHLSGILSEIDETTFAVIQDTHFYPNPVHSTLDEVLTYYPKSLHPLLYGIHYEDSVTPSPSHPIRLLQQGTYLMSKEMR